MLTCLFCLFFGGQPDSGLICLVSFSFSFEFLFEFSVTFSVRREERGKGGREEGIEKMNWSVPNKDTSR